LNLLNRPCWQSCSGSIHAFLSSLQVSCTLFLHISKPLSRTFLNTAIL
jgi:hypothetical protein